VKPLVSLVILLLATTAATGRTAPVGNEPSWTAPTAGWPHPGVARVIVPDRVGTSFGSGALVAASDKLGLVVTNWHVVRDARGPIVVAFPDGFRSQATVLGTDPDWDLAALAIWRPPVDPIRLATQPPQPGEPLTIAGYGSGSYRAVTGRCTQYVSPGRNHPFEMVELSAGARDGDSGGPIFNRRGELAGVLFGSASGHTTGSYCGRVRGFLTSVAHEFQRLDANSTMIARQPEPDATPLARQAQPRPGAGWQASPTDPTRAEDAPASGPLPVVAIPARPSQPAESGTRQPSADPPDDGWTASVPEPGAPGEATPPDAAEPLRWEDVAGSTPGEQVKTVLAGVGLLAIFFHGLRLLSKGQAS